MDCSIPLFPVLHYLPEFAQTHTYWWCYPPSHPVAPFSSSQHQSFPESALLIRLSKYWSFISSPSNEYSGLISFRIDWFDLAVQGTLKSLLQTTVQKHQFFGAQPSLWSNSHIHTTTRKTTALTRRTLVSKVMSLLFNMLSRFVTAFLPRSKHFNFMAAVIICSDFGA